MFYLKYVAAPCRLGLLVFMVIALVACSSLADRVVSADGEGSPTRRTVKLVPPSGSEYARFGHAVATDGQTVVVGAWGEAAEAGAVYVYELTAQGWERTARLVPAEASAGARFGYSLDVESGRIAVGALYEASQGRDAGAVFIFERDGSIWKQTAELTPAGPAEYAHFGRSVALEGDRLAVGAPGPGASAVHTFVNTASGWQPDQVLEYGATGDEIRFGTSLALAHDTLAVGGWTGNPDTAGFVVVYEHSQSGWAEAARLLSGESGDRFGYSVSLEGQMLAVGAPDAREGPRLHLFELDGGTWSKLAPVMPAEHSRELGHVVALHKGKVLAGDPAFDGPADHSGQVVLAEAGGGGTDILVPVDVDEGSSFGFSVAAAGGVIVVGAVGDDSRGIAAGAAYIFY